MYHADFGPILHPDATANISIEQMFVALNNTFGKHFIGPKEV